MTYVDHTALEVVCTQAKLPKEKMHQILVCIQERYSKGCDFHALWQPAVSAVANADLFESKAYRSAIARYYALRKAARNITRVKASNMEVERSSSMDAVIRINAAVSIHFRALQPYRFGTLHNRNVEMISIIYRARLSTEITQSILDAAAGKARAAMNIFRKRRRK